MRTEAVSLRHLSTGRPIVVTLPEITGRGEMDVDGVDTRSAIDLIRRLLPASIEAGGLTASDRDAILAALHRRCWGDRIVTTMTCTSCEGTFDVSFELSAVQRHLADQRSIWSAAAGRVVHPDGSSFGIPTGHDEIAAAATGPAGAVAHLMRVSGAIDGPEPAASALEATAPIVDLELDATCASCGHRHRVHFDVQAYVLQRLINERQTLFAEVHTLATRYGWSLDEILALTRSARRSFAALAEARTSTRERGPRGPS